MSQFVETRVGDFLGEGATTAIAPSHAETDDPGQADAAEVGDATSGDRRRCAGATASAQPVPMTSAAARFAVEPPPPIIKPKQEQAAPKPAEKRPDQIFTF